MCILGLGHIVVHLLYMKLVCIREAWRPAADAAAGGRGAGWAPAPAAGQFLFVESGQRPGVRRSS